MIAEYFGIDSDYIILGVAGVSLLLFIIFFIILCVNIGQIKKLKKKYIKFMGGSDAKSLETQILEHLELMDGLTASVEENRKNIEKLFKNMKYTFQKVGLVKYDAFNEMGGKLSFSLALLNEENDGFVLNAVHSREGCYTYIKEIVGGNSIIVLAKEEQEALDMAKANMKM